MINVNALSDAAWSARERARVHGPTRVGAAALATDGSIYAGANVEHRFRSHDVHAEVNAISTLVAASSEALVAIFIAAERDHFTPCGACLDWVFEIGGPDTEVLVQGALGGPVTGYRAKDLMPHYPR